MSFTELFGGTTLYPADVSYLALTLTADVTLEWPFEAQAGNDIVARIIDITPDAPHAIIMPDASLASVGEVVLFNNLGPSSVTVKSSTGTTLITLATGEQWELYLYDNSTVTGLWRAFRFGAAVAQAQASALAGPGLVAIGSLLAQSQNVSTFSTDYSLGPADRGSAFVWVGGVGNLNLPSASSVGNNWFFSTRNGGTGNLTVDAAGGDLINGVGALVLRPGDSATVVTDGTSFYTVGLGQDPVFAFDYTSINLAGQASPYTLSGSELNRIAYRFVGVLTHNITIYVPSTTQQYWIANDTTGGTYTLSVGTSTQGSPLTVARGSRGIYYCEGSTLVKADTASIATPIAISDGGTGATSASAARIALGGTSVGIAVFTAATGADARLDLSAAAAGVNADITQLTGLTTPLSISQGGTGAGTLTGFRTTIGAAASGANSDITSLTGLTTPLAVSQGGIGVATITGLLKGSGTSAVTAAVAGTDYVKPDTASTWSAVQSFLGSSTVVSSVFNNAAETVTVSATAATGTINYNLAAQSVLYYTSNAAANWVMNFRHSGSASLDSVLSTGQSMTCVFLVQMGVTPYYNTSVQIDGTTTGVTTKWQGAAPTAGVASSLAVYTFTIIKTGSATFTVLASVTSFA